MGWKEIPKIDAHVHIIPNEVHAANPDADDEFSFATTFKYQKAMDAFNIQRAVVMPFNDPFLMSMNFTVDAVHQNMLRICKEDDRFCCFADIDIRNTPENTCKHIEEALVNPEFCGIKLHPNNSGMNIDDAYNDIIADHALKHDSPIAVHSYPSNSREQDRDECCAPERIGRWMHRHPGLKVIVCHLGGFQWEDAVKLDAYFDISAILPDLTHRYGVKKANKILREFGTERLLFGTDWPCSRSVEPVQIVKHYIDILEQMDFTEREIHRIGHSNAESFLGLPQILCKDQKMVQSRAK